MAEPHSIAPFPADIDRDAFGHWLSGFTDGEGSFNLYAVTDASDGRRESLRAAFRLAQRADDTATLQRMQSFWRCGTLHYTSNVRSKIRNAKPVRTFSVSAISDLVSVVLPHFETFPLRSKKQRDFTLWKQGVLMVWEVSRRPSPQTGRRWCQHRGISKWTDDERHQFKVLVEQLKSLRKYDAGTIPVIPATSRSERPEKTLFDELPD